MLSFLFARLFVMIYKYHTEVDICPDATLQSREVRNILEKSLDGARK